jgi:hypothetical protein
VGGLRTGQRRCSDAGMGSEREERLVVVDVDVGVGVVAVDSRSK